MSDEEGFWIKIDDRKWRWFSTKEKCEEACRPRREFHFVEDDTMEATMHPVTGEMLDSKSEFRRRTRAAGCIEFGNENLILPKPKIKDDTHEIGKQIWDHMERNHIDHKVLARDIRDTFELAKRMQRHGK